MEDAVERELVGVEPVDEVDLLLADGDDVAAVYRTYPPGRLERFVVSVGEQHRDQLVVPVDLLDGELAGEQRVVRSHGPLHDRASGIRSSTPSTRRPTMSRYGRGRAHITVAVVVIGGVYEGEGVADGVLSVSDVGAGGGINRPASLPVPDGPGARRRSSQRSPGGAYGRWKTQYILATLWSDSTVDT